VHTTSAHATRAGWLSGSVVHGRLDGKERIRIRFDLMDFLEGFRWRWPSAAVSVASSRDRGGGEYGRPLSYYIPGLLGPYTHHSGIFRATNRLSNGSRRKRSGARFWGQCEKKAGCEVGGAGQPPTLSGMVKKNVEPLPGVDSTEILPP
jgi:hypothetical protein